MKNFFIRTAAAIAATGMLLFISATFFFIGCDEGQQMMKPIVDEVTEPADTTPPAMVGEMKKDEASDEDESDEVAKSEEPVDTTPPTVVEVSWYHDWQLQQPIIGDVRPGNTIYAKVVFSEPMQHLVADDDTALPALSVLIGEQATRFRMAAHGASGKNFLSGTCKPLHGGTDDYLCKYTVPETRDVGTIALKVGFETTAKTGVSVIEGSIHLAAFVVKVMPEEPVVMEPTTAPEPELIPEPTGPEETIFEPVDEARRQAEEVVDHIIALLNEDGAINNETKRIRIIEEESGLAYESFIRGTLLDIYFEERPEEKGDPFSWYDIVLEYLRLGFMHPDASEEELLDHFRQSVRDGRVTIDIGKSVYIKKRRDQREKQKRVLSETRPIFERISEREIEVLQQYHLENIPLDLPAELNAIFMEEAGISFDFAHNTLLAIHLEENPRDKDVVTTGVYRYAPLIRVYLFFRRTFDSEEEEDILNRFRKFSGEGNTPITLPAPLAAFNFQ